MPFFRSFARLCTDIIYSKYVGRNPGPDVDGRQGTSLNGVIEFMVNVKEQKLGQNKRMSFSKSRYTLDLPNLVEVQTKSITHWLKVHQH